MMLMMMMLVVVVVVSVVVVMVMLLVAVKLGPPLFGKLVDRFLIVVSCFEADVVGALWDEITKQ